MPLQFETINSFILANSGDDVVVPRPAGIEAGDLLLGVAGIMASKASCTSPASWNRVDFQDNSATANGPTSVVDWIEGTGSEPADWTWTFNGGPSTFRYGFVVRISGHDAITPVNAILEGNIALDLATPFPAAVPTVTTDVDGCLILRIINTAGGVGVTHTISGVTATERLDIFDSSAGMAMYTEDVLQASAGATGGATINVSTVMQALTWTIAIAPAAVAAASNRGPYRTFETFRGYRGH